MKFTVTSYIETLHNCSGRFKALDGAIPVTDQAGDPCISISASGMVSFLLDWKGLRHTVSAIEPPYEHRSEIISACRTTVVRNNRYIAQAVYFVEEMLIFDNNGNCRYTDLVVQPYYQDTHDLIRKHAFLSDRDIERHMLEGLAAMAENMTFSGIVHGRINLGSLRFDDDLSPVLLDYPFSTAAREQSRDSRFLLKATTVIYLVGCDARLYLIMQERKALNDDVFNACKRAILTAAEHYHIEALEQVVLLVEDPHDRLAVNYAIKSLAQTAFQDLPLLRNLLQDKLDWHPKESFSPERSAESKRDDGLTLDFSKCEYTGDFCDGLYCFKLNDKWGYADRNGKVLIDGLLYAQDFYESRAAVKTVRGFGLIDRDGNMAMDDTFEDLSWCGEYGVAIAMHDGEWRMYDRNGKPLSAGYDWMDDCNEGFSVVERNHRFGYIDCKGRPLTELRYSHAGRFNNGQATVEHDSSHYEIDRRGCRQKHHVGEE